MSRYVKPALPRATHEHVRALRLMNETAYDGRAIRSMLVACLRFLGLRVRGAVRVTYATRGRGMGHHGRAALGDEDLVPNLSGLNMVLCLPRDPRKLDEGVLAWLMHHEALHWKGVRHEDMTDEQLYVGSWRPSWWQVWRRDREAALLTDAGPSAVGWTPAPVRAPADESADKIRHAEAMLKKARTRVLRAQSVEARWRRRLAGLEAARERRERATAGGTT